MKHTILTIALLTALNANATNYGNPLQGSSASANSAAIAIQGQSQNNAVNVQGASNGAISNGNGDVTLQNNYDSERIPVSSAIAPSLTQNVICPIITPNSHAVQFLFFGGSTTGTQSLNLVCLAYHLNDIELVNTIACNQSSEYKKAMVQLGRTCK